MDSSTNVDPSHKQENFSQNIRHIFETLMQLPGDESHLHFLENHMEDVASEFKTTLTSTTLGLDHPSTTSFQQVQDGFG